MTDLTVVPFTVASDLDLGASAEPWLRVHGADVTIRRGPVPEALPQPDSRGVTWAWTPGKLLIHVPCGLRLLVEEGESITYSADADLAEADIRLFLLGTAWSALALQRGLIPLRASAVARGRNVYAICGAAATGKSLLAATLSGRRFSFFADSVLLLDPARGCNETWCWGSDDLQLEPEGLSLAGLGAAAGRGCVREADGHRKVYAEPYRRSDHVAGRLGAVHVLRDRTGPPDVAERTRTEQIGGRRATTALWAGVDGLPIARAVLGRETLFRQLASLACNVTVFAFYRTMGNEWFVPVVNALDSHLSALGHDPPDATP